MDAASFHWVWKQQQYLLCLQPGLRSVHAMNILSVTEAGNRRAAGCLAGSTRPGGQVCWGWGGSRGARAGEADSQTKTQQQNLPPHPARLPFPSEQSQAKREPDVMERGGSSRRGAIPLASLRRGKPR